MMPADARDELAQLAGFAAGLQADSLPARVVDKATLILLDTVGVIIGGSATGELRALAGRMGLGIEAVAEPVAGQVGGPDECRDEQAGKQREPPCDSASRAG